MAEKVYITDEERKKCRRTAEIYAELYELTDVMVVDAGRFGFVILQCFNDNEEFESAVAYTDNSKLFEKLWRIWFEYQVLMPVLGTPLAELDYDDIFKCLPKKRQDEIMEKKQYFIEKSTDSTPSKVPI